MINNGMRFSFVMLFSFLVILGLKGGFISSFEELTNYFIGAIAGWYVSEMIIYKRM